MKLPEQIIIGPIAYDVSFESGLDDHTEYTIGRIKYKNAQIHISPSVAVDMTANVLFHEMLHGVLYGVGEHELNDNEGLVDRVGSALLAALLYSPGLLEYLEAVRDGE